MAALKPVSLREVMDQELALKLQQQQQTQEDEELRYQLQLIAQLDGPAAQSASSNASGGVHDEDEELRHQIDLIAQMESKEAEAAAEAAAVARAQEEEEAHNKGKKKDSEATTELETDAEIARRLAEEEDYLYALSLEDARGGARRTPTNSKVSVVGGGGNEVQALTRGDEAADSSEEDEPTINPIMAAAAQQQRNGRKKNAAAAAAAAARAPTKHDIEITSKYHAQNISKFLDTGRVESDVRLPNKVYNTLKQTAKELESSRIRVHGQDDFASYEQALDARTRLILFKLLNSGVLAEIHGVVATGKEANVYYAVGNALLGEDAPQISGLVQELVGGPYAIKIFKTTLNEFRDRDQYIREQYRFHNQLKMAKHNTRKLIKLWAQKEMRNLIKIHRAGIPSPAPVLLREQVLVMSFIGDDGRPAPHIKDVAFSEQELQGCFLQCIHIMRDLYHKCRLVHADLSEFNILWYKGQSYVIDVGQAVEFDHPSALDFLRRDCLNIARFFRSRGVPCSPSARQLFEFVTDPLITVENVNNYLQRVAQQNAQNPKSQEEEEDAVFMNSFIPRTLSDVRNPVRDLDVVAQGRGHELLYPRLHGLAESDLSRLSHPEILTEDYATDSDPDSELSD